MPKTNTSAISIVPWLLGPTSFYSAPIDSQPNPIQFPQRSPWIYSAQPTASTDFPPHPSKYPAPLHSPKQLDSDSLEEEPTPPQTVHQNSVRTEPQHTVANNTALSDMELDYVGGGYGNWTGGCWTWAGAAARGMVKVWAFVMTEAGLTENLPVADAELGGVEDIGGRAKVGNWGVYGWGVGLL